MDNYFIRRANHINDAKELNELLTRVFYPEEVGKLAEVFFNHLPGTKNQYWYIAEEKETSAMVSAFTLIPWTWEMQGIKLKVAEMGLVGTLENHRGKGLMKMLKSEFDQTLLDEQFDLAVIQGIPGFYHKFGYHYAISMENHINISLDRLPEITQSKFFIRLATLADIPFLMKEDENYRSSYFISSVRNEADWKYQLEYGRQTDYASEIWIMDSQDRKQQYYFKILLKGFGTGLILQEMSENMSDEAHLECLNYCRNFALERGKPYIRLNMPHNSKIANYIFSLGVKPCKSYAWQIKIPNLVKMLRKMKPILENRLRNSRFEKYTGKLRLDLYGYTIDITWNNGIIINIDEGDVSTCTNTFCINQNLFASLIFGHHSWEELQYIHPDIAPELLYLYPTEESLNDNTGELINTLFPVCKSWIYSRY